MDEATFLCYGIFIHKTNIRPKEYNYETWQHIYGIFLAGLLPVLFGYDKNQAVFVYTKSSPNTTSEIYHREEVKMLYTGDLVAYVGGISFVGAKFVDGEIRIIIPVD